MLFPPPVCEASNHRDFSRLLSEVLRQAEHIQLSPQFWNTCQIFIHCMLANLQPGPPPAVLVPHVFRIAVVTNHLRSCLHGFLLAQAAVCKCFVMLRLLPGEEVLGHRDPQRQLQGRRLVLCLREPQLGPARFVQRELLPSGAQLLSASPACPRLELSWQKEVQHDVNAKRAGHRFVPKRRRPLKRIRTVACVLMKCSTLPILHSHYIAPRAAKLSIEALWHH